MSKVYLVHVYDAMSMMKLLVGVWLCICLFTSVYPVTVYIDRLGQVCSCHVDVGDYRDGMAEKERKERRK